MVMVVGDPDAAFARAVKAGASVVWPIIFWPINVWSSNDKEYRWRVGRIVDPLRTSPGNRQAFGRRLTASLGLLPGS